MTHTDPPQPWPNRTGPRLFHFRDSGEAEVDLVVEADDGRVVAIEVKATSTPRPEDFRWLTYPQDRRTV